MHDITYSLYAQRDGMFQILASGSHVPRISYPDEQFVYTRAASAIGLIAIMFLALGHALCEISRGEQHAFFSDSIGLIWQLNRPA